jgi:hypothetical protein
MARLWQWFAARGRANGKKVAAGKSAGAAPPVRPSSFASRGAAAKQAAEQWDEDGERADQDYYHVPGAGNPDRADPPTLDGEVLPSPKTKVKGGAKARVKSRSS